jgi:SAM-dependent methyltransferase
VARAERLTRQAQLEDYCRFECGDAMAMPYPDGSFDVVYAIESACHMPDKARFYANCARVLQPGGRLAGWDWVRTRFLSPAEHERLIEPICRYFAIPDVCTLDDIGAWIRAGSGRTMVWVAAGAAYAEPTARPPPRPGQGAATPFALVPT